MRESFRRMAFILSSLKNLVALNGIQALYFTYIGEGNMDFLRFELL